MIAFDAATQSGYAYKSNGQWRIGTIDPRKGDVLLRVLAEARTAGVTECAIENCYHGKNALTTITLARIQGRIEAACERVGIAWHYVHPMTWKSAQLAGARVRADQKTASIRMARMLGALPANDDEADAVCICDYATANARYRKMETEAKNKARNQPAKRRTKG